MCIRTYSYAFNDKVFICTKAAQISPGIVYVVHINAHLTSYHQTKIHITALSSLPSQLDGASSFCGSTLAIFSHPNQTAELKGNSNSTYPDSLSNNYAAGNRRRTTVILKSSAHSLVVAAFSSKEIGSYRSILARFSIHSHALSISNI